MEERERAWKGASRGVLAAALFLFFLAGIFLETGLGWPFDALLGVAAGAVVLALAGLAVLALAAVLERLPRSFVLAAGAAAGALVALASSPYGAFRWPADLLAPGLLVFLGAQAALGGAIALALTGGWRSRRVLVLLSAALIVDLGGILWLAAEGRDPYPLAPLTVEGDLPGEEPPEPAERGGFEVETLFYGSGTNPRRPEFGAHADVKTPTVDGSLVLPEWKGFKARAREWYWGFGIDEAPLNGRVWYPVGDGPFPLVLIVHGNHRMEDYSDPGYAYLGELLASRGFITVSVDQNFVNGTWSGDFNGREMPVRAWLLLEHLRLWREWSRTEGNPLSGKIDMSKIGLAGHSRGGEAVAIAAAFNRLSHFPDDARVRFDYGFDIRSLVAIAQIDRRYERRVELENVNFLALQGTYDADEPSFHGIRQFGRIRFRGDGYRFKSGLLIHHANHGQFNSVWGRRDSGPPGSWFLNLAPLIPGEDQRRIAQVYVSAFLEATLHGDERYLPLLRDHRAGSRWLPEGAYVSRFLDSTFRPVADYEEDLDLTTGAEGVRIRGENLSVWKERDLPFRDDSRQGNNAVYVGWRAAEGSPARYSIELPEDFDLGERNVLAFALAEVHDPENEIEAPLDLSLELVDASGRTARLPLSRIAPIQKPLRSRFLKLGWLNGKRYGPAWEPALQTYELPLADFEGDFDPGSVRTVRFVFDRAPKGAIILDEIGFSSPARSSPGYP